MRNIIAITHFAGRLHACARRPRGGSLAPRLPGAERDLGLILCSFPCFVARPFREKYFKPGKNFLRYKEHVPCRVRA
jgi:hypothetical protein